MRAKTSRLYKKAMHSYCISFNFRTPYQILLDSSFCKLATEQRLNLQQDLQTVLCNPTRPMVTECVIQELHKTGDHRAATVAKSFERRKCKHHLPVTSQQCILELIGSNNDNNYVIATQNDIIRKQIHDIPGVPVLRVKNGMIILEPLSKVTKDAILQKEKEKTLPSSAEAQQLKIAKLVQKPPTEPVHKKRKVKGANPLSMKKKKKQSPPPPKKQKNQGNKKNKNTNNDKTTTNTTSKTGEKRKRSSDDTKDS
ncbi:Fcf1-domain-containing protein [Halteromyces radiatus]|uniref:Fcf1-domain-containing protein n=1 Tax=Halteromyces radiatus TaxID=101107 RepID=UPI00221E9B0E|nr:Fcf1-domain-containing protein [Halteromyces radiatus]KAI8092557.1 Fcf1-domain-containing protein [Halteromyces radiatus]